MFKRMIWTFLVAMIPAVEVKGAIPFGIALGLKPVLSYISAIVGSGIIVCCLAFITNLFYRFCKERGHLKRFIGWMDKIATKNHKKIKKFGPLAIFIYVAIPVPGTGTWTGAIIAGVLNIKPKHIIIAVILGNMVAGFIMCLASMGLVSALGFLK